jgi:hypothetical protein
MSFPLGTMLELDLNGPLLQQGWTRLCSNREYKEAKRKLSLTITLCYFFSNSEVGIYLRGRIEGIRGMWRYLKVQ